MAEITVKLDGVREAAQGMLANAKVKAGAMEQALLMEGEELMTEAQQQVPRRTGFLANSRFVVLTARGMDAEVIVGFTAGYALKVHEASAEVRFRVGKRKFLEDPFKRREAGAPQRIADRVRAISGD